ncbi:MAG: YdiU family protein [Xanthomonadaceae bacterium]|nr:YdiU family protein [Xanthomonadaceae bacterium]
MHFDNRFLYELPGDPEEGARRRQVPALWSRVSPTPVRDPRWVAHSADMASLLGLSEAALRSEPWLRTLAGNALMPGMEPYASNYGGHQFGHWAGQLGDGRAISLGEAVVDGKRWELQLKGAGETPYARSADGRAVMRSSVREFLCSEAMHHLGVPTTRALSLIATGEDVIRDMFYDGHPRPEPGAVVCRVAPSFLRFGHFELPFSRGDSPLVRRLADFAIDRDFPELAEIADPRARDAEWFGQICERSARMVAEWMRVGFVHGVMNTDNMSILGLTIDYGPYGWIEDYDPDWTPNTTDAQGKRYRFGWQPAIVRWNLGRLAQALSPLFADAEALREGIERFGVAYTAAERDNTARKLGLRECRDDDVAAIRELYALMHDSEADMTLTFSALTELDLAVADAESAFDALREAFYDATKRDAQRERWLAWLHTYARRVGEDGGSSHDSTGTAINADTDAQRRARMRTANPVYVLRNYLAQEAIDRAERGDFEGVTELLDILRRPYDSQPGRERYAAKRPDWARTRAGCSMLSCSS